jgi:hypothetical protein
MNINNIECVGSVTKSISLVLMAGVALSLLACSATQKAPISKAEAHCGLLGRFCDRLTPGTEDQLGLRYVRPGVDWRKYKAVLIEPVTFWGDEEGGASAEVRQELVNQFETVLKQEFGKQFQVVNRPGPGVMTLSVGMTKAESATPVLRSISMIVPQARALSTGAYLISGQFPFVGTAQVEGKVEDSVSGQVLAAIVDKRLGGGSPTAGFQWQWGDVENAMQHWSETVANRLAGWTSGQQKAQ